VQKLIAAGGVLLLAVFMSLSALAQEAPPSEASRKAELSAAWQAASKAGSAGPKDIALIDQATLKLPADYFFVPKAEGAHVLRALGNVVNDSSFLGLVVGQQQSAPWIVVIHYVKEGYIKDDDAKHWNADELLKNISVVDVAGEGGLYRPSLHLDRARAAALPVHRPQAGWPAVPR